MGLGASHPTSTEHRPPSERLHLPAAPDGGAKLSSQMELGMCGLPSLTSQGAVCGLGGALTLLQPGPAAATRQGDRQATPSPAHRLLGCSQDGGAGLPLCRAMGCWAPGSRQLSLYLPTARVPRTHLPSCQRGSWLPRGHAAGSHSPAPSATSS